MSSSIAVPFHFISSFVVTIAALGGLWVSVARPKFVPQTKWLRRFFGAGFVLLSLAEMMHGARIATTELDQSVVALRAGAYALFAGSLLPPERRRKSAASAAATAPTGAFLPMFLAVPAAWFAYRHPLPAAKRLAVAFGGFAVAEIIFQSCNCLELSTPTFSWYLGHTVRLAGGVAVGSWLWQAIKTSVQARFVATFLALLLIAVVAISGSLTQVFTQNVANDARDRITDEGRDQKEGLDRIRDEALSSARILAQTESVRRAVAEKSPALGTQVTGLQSPKGLFERFDFVAYLDGTGAILAVSAAGPNGTQNLNQAETLALAGTAVVSSALTGQEAASMDSLGANKIVVVAAFPVFNPPGFDPPGSPQGLAGVATIGNVMNDRYLLANIKKESEENDATLISRDEILARTLPDATGILLSDKREATRVFDAGRVLIKNAVLGFQRVEYSTAYIPLTRTDGAVVGALVLTQRSEILEQTQSDVGRRLFLFSLLATLIVGFVAFLSGSRITRPIRDLTSAAERVRAGDLETPVATRGADEVGILSEAFGAMTTSVRQLTDDLRAKAEEEAKIRSELETILQSMTDGLVAIDVDGKIVALNREAERMLGAGRNANGTDIRKVLKLRDLAGSPIDPQIFDLTEGSVTGVVDNARGPIHVAITSSPIKGEEGQVLGGVALIRDLTGEMQIEKMKTEFLSNISHELRTPLTPIIAYADLLRRKNVSRPKAMTFVDGIISAGRRLERIVQMLVDFSAMEAGRLVPRVTPTNLAPIVGELVTQWDKEAKKHQFGKTGFTKLPMVNVDPNLVRGALNELLDNAVKFSPKGGKITIAAEIDAAQNGAGNLRVSVADQGIGIAPEDLAKIDEDFVQVDSSATREFGGLGLGLAYVRRIVEGHGGRLEIRSSPQKGSRFTLVIPTSRSRGVTVTKPKSRNQAPVSRARRARPIKKRSQ